MKHIDPAFLTYSHAHPKGHNGLTVAYCRDFLRHRDGQVYSAPQLRRVGLGFIAGALTERLYAIVSLREGPRPQLGVLDRIGGGYHLPQLCLRIGQ